MKIRISEILLIFPFRRSLQLCMLSANEDVSCAVDKTFNKLIDIVSRHFFSYFTNMSLVLEALINGIRNGLCFTLIYRLDHAQPLAF